MRARRRRRHPVIVTAPGEEAQVDYGEGAMVRHRATGKYRCTRLFILTLGHSRNSVRLVTWKSSSQTWAELHEQAFRRLGGMPQTIVLDSRKASSPPTSTIRHSIRSSAMSWPTTASARYHAASAIPIVRARSSRASGTRSERRCAACASRRWSRSRRTSISGRPWADTRIHGTTKRQVAAMLAEEQPALRPLRLTPFCYYRYGTRVVHLDGCVEVDGVYYSAPPGYLGQRVPVQWDGARRKIASIRARNCHNARTRTFADLRASGRSAGDQ